MTNLDSILKSRDITLPTKVGLVKAMVFWVVMYGCESWTIKKAEHRRLDAFELWCWRRLLRVPWTARRANQSILKETSPECSSEGLMLKLKLQYSDHLIRRTDSFENTLMLGKIEGSRIREWWRMRWLDGVTNSWISVWVNFGSWWWTGRPGVLQSMGSQWAGHDWAELYSPWGHRELDMTERLSFAFLPSAAPGRHTARLPSQQLQGKDCVLTFPVRWPVCPGSRLAPPSTSHQHSFPPPPGPLLF